MERQINLQNRLTKAVLLCILLAAGMAAQVAQAQTSMHEVHTGRVDPTPAMRTELDKAFAAYQVVSIDVAMLNDLALSGNTLFSMNTGNEEWMLQLQPFEIRTEDYEQRLNDRVIGERPPCPTFRGSDMLHPNRKLFALISPDFVAFCSKDEKNSEAYYVDQLNVLMKDKEIDPKLFVVYKESDVIAKEGTCSASAEDAFEHSEHGHDDHFNLQKNHTQKCILLAKIETNTDAYALVLNFLGLTSLANSYTLNIINLVSDIYWDFTGIQLLVSAQNNYAFGGPAPWAFDTNSDAYFLRDSFRDWMNVNRPYSSFNRTVSVLFTGRDITSVDNNGVTTNIIIGLAYFPSSVPLCSSYNINEIRTSSAEQTILVAHELGHNFGATHCQGSGCGPSPDCNTQTGTIMCGVCCSNTPVFTDGAAATIRSNAIDRLDVAGCFGTFTRTLTTANDPNCYFGNCTGTQNLNFIYHTVQTSGTMVIGNNHSGITWNAGERFILKPGFKAAPNAVGKQVKIGILPCDAFLGTGGASSAQVQVPNETAAKEPGSLQLEQGIDFRVYPNPAQQQVTVELVNPGDAMFQMHWYDIYGRVLDIQQVNSEEQTHFIFDLSPFADGMYILQITNQNNQFNQTLKVQKLQ